MRKLVPFPGSELFRKVYGNKKDKIDWETFNYFSGHKTCNLHPLELKRLQKKALRSFYSNPLTVLNLLLRIRPKQIPYLIKAVVNYIV